jgi:hypothetical protein
LCSGLIDFEFVAFLRGVVSVVERFSAAVIDFKAINRLVKLVLYFYNPTQHFSSTIISKILSINDIKSQTAINQHRLQRLFSVHGTDVTIFLSTALIYSCVYREFNLLDRGDQLLLRG